MNTSGHSISPAPQPDWSLLRAFLTAHRELRHSARIRLVFDALAEGLKTMVRAN